MKTLMRKFFVGGNWKSNNTLAETQTLIAKTLNPLSFNPERTEVAVFPPTLHITEAQRLLSNKHVQLGAQNISKFGFGAFTGETSALHLRDIGVGWALVGHSERRALFAESSGLVAEKARFALEQKLGVVLCVGESLAEREQGRTLAVVRAQLGEVREALDAAAWERVVVAYEPVWAIGTGRVASPEQAQEVHAFIRAWLAESVAKETADEVRIIYGGSVTEKNCEELIRQRDIDGFLVGGASLKPVFADIVRTVDAHK